MTATPSVSFANTYTQFLDELTATFPEYATSLLAAKALPNARSVFLSVWKIHTKEISQQKVSIFDGAGLDLVPGVKMTISLWNELSANSQAAIWKYLTTLLLIGVSEDTKTEGIWDMSGFEHDMEEMIRRMKSGTDGTGMKDIFEKLTGMMDMSGAFGQFAKAFSGMAGGLGGDGPDLSGAAPKFKIPERLFKGHIAKIAEEIVSEFNPADFGLPPELLESNDPTKIFTFLQEIFTQKPDMLMGIAKRIAKKIQTKFQQGALNRDELIREAEELMKEFSDNATFSDLFGNLSEMMKGSEKETGNEGSSRRREVQERLRKQKAEKDAKKAARAGAVVSGLPTNDLMAAAALADANANALLMEEGSLPALSGGNKKGNKARSAEPRRG
jgi:hypothetical protein